MTVEAPRAGRRVQEAGCGTLWNVIACNANNQVKIAGEGGIERVLWAMAGAYAEHAGGQEGRHEALRNLASNTAENRIQIYSEEGIGLVL